MGLTLNEYALATLKGERRVGGRSEEEIYAKLKLDYIPPELRENTGEIAAAEHHKLPHLITLKDMKGDLQMHSTASDGRTRLKGWRKRRGKSAITTSPSPTIRKAGPSATAPTTSGSPRPFT